MIVQSNLRKVAWNGLGISLFLTCLFIPFETSFVPSLGLWLQAYLNPMLKALGTWLLPSCTSCIWEPISDSHGLYLLALICLVIGSCIALLIHQRRWSTSSCIYRSVRVCLLLYLSMQVAGYGVQKLLMQQFFTPEANILFTPFGELEKDILFWSTMGVSPSYNLFLGIMEIIPAIFLLHYRTRLLGLAMLSMVLLHVLMIDISFDIDVKFYAAFLLGISLYLIWPLVSRMRSESKGSVITIRTEHWLPYRLWIQRAKPFVYILLLLEIGSPIFNKFLYNPTPLIPSELVGAYDVLDLDDEIRKVFIHSKGYLITMDAENRFTDHRIMMDAEKKAIILLDESRSLSLSTSSYSKELKIQGLIGSRLIRWELDRIELDSLPLLQDKTEWIVRH